MTLATYALYFAAILLLILTPGPTMLMCVSNALNHGPRRAIASLCGALAANFAIMGLSALGLGAVLAASESAFTALKLLGAAYLVWLGIRTFRSPALMQQAGEPQRRGSFFLQGVMVGASNPKSLLFFTAFFPQFIDPARPFVPQFLALSLTFVVADFIILGCGAFGVGRIAPRLRDARVVRAVNRTCGALFATLGGLLLLSRRAG